MTEKTDVTDRATAAGWALPAGWRVLAWTEPEEGVSDPRDWGDVYRTDVDEKDYSHRTRGFCRHCDAWIHKIDQAEADAINTELFKDDPAYPGDWLDAVADSTSTRRRCPETCDVHALDEPVAVKWWRDDKWSFVYVSVEVIDPDGRVWGADSLGMVEAGTYPYKIDPETGEITSKEIDPLTDPDHPLPGLIGEALGQARNALVALAASRPVITGPKAAN